MTAFVLGVFLLQAQAPQVGDTIWLTRSVAADGREVRAPAWQPEGAIEALGPGLVVQRGENVEVRYPAVGWLPGNHVVQVPGPVLVSPDGTTDTLPAQPVTITIASVLPDLPGDALPEPQPEAALVLRPERTPVPLILLLALSGLLLVPIHLFWRRRGPPPPPEAVPAGMKAPVLDAGRWAAAGEMRAVLAVAGARLRRSAADAPGTEAAALLEELESAAYGPVPPADAPELVARAEGMLRQLHSAVRG
jgi:hypothetical protein